jgi:glucose uptake protein
MWTPDGPSEAFPLCVLSLVCWGSWSNSAKAASHVPFCHFYLDYSIGLFLMALIWFYSLGEGEFFVDSTTEMAKVWSAVGAGTIFNIANILLTVGIQRLGLSLAFPIGIGTALVLGTVLTYIVNPSGDVALLFGGVAVAFLAVCSISLSANEMEKAEKLTDGGGTASDPLLDDDDDDYDENGGDGDEKSGDEERMVDRTGAGKPSKTKDSLVCLLAGVFMSCWAPLSAYSYDTDTAGALTPYGSFLCFAGATLVTSLLYIPVMLSRPLIGEKTTASAYCELSWADHSWGVMGGGVWSIGTLSNLIAGSEINGAVAYSIGQSAPMVATLWGLLYYNEYAGAPRSAYMYLFAMFALYILSIVLIAESTT